MPWRHACGISGEHRNPYALAVNAGSTQAQKATPPVVGLEIDLEIELWIDLGSRAECLHQKRVGADSAQRHPDCLMVAGRAAQSVPGEGIRPHRKRAARV